MAIVHNGVIENFRPLKERLAERRLRLPLGDRHRSHRPPDRRLPGKGAGRHGRHHRRASDVDAIAGYRAAGRRGAPGARPSCTAPTAWRSCFATIPTCSSPPGSAARWSSASATASTSWPATPRRWSGYTDKIVYLADHELAVVTADSLRVIHRDQGARPHTACSVLDMAGRRRRARRLSRTTCSRKSSSSPRRLRNAMRGRLEPGRGHGRTSAA